MKDKLTEEEIKKLKKLREDKDKMVKDEKLICK